MNCVHGTQTMGDFTGYVGMIYVGMIYKDYHRMSFAR